VYSNRIGEVYVTITIEHISSNVCRLSHDTETEWKALNRLLERKIKDGASGEKVPITVAWVDERGAGLIPAGLANWLEENLRHKFTVVNHYSEEETPIPVIDSDFAGKEIRDYQMEAARTLLRAARGIMWGSVGCGKTFVLGAMINAILRTTSYRVCVIGYTVDHWNQVQKTLEEMGIHSQQVGKGNPEARVVIGRFDAFNRCIKKQGPWNIWLRTCEIIFCDEVRHIGKAASYINFYRNLGAIRYYGFDGTPLRNFKTDDPYELFEDMNVKGYCGPVLVKVGYKELQKAGYIPLTYVHFVPMPFPPGKIGTDFSQDIKITTDYRRIYTQLIVENDFRTARFARLITSLAGSGKVIAMVKEHEHAKRLMHMLSDNGVECLAWFGNDETLAITPMKGVYHPSFGTKEVKRRFMEDSLPVVVGSSVLSEAISLDVATDAVNLAGGNSFNLSVQRVGRIMRLDKGRTPVVRFWDAEDKGNIVLESHSKQRKAQYQAAGLDVVDFLFPEAVFDWGSWGIQMRVSDDF
jgi:superfamily II DNA or RNA helicase